MKVATVAQLGERPGGRRAPVAVERGEESEHGRRFRELNRSRLGDEPRVPPKSGPRKTQRVFVAEEQDKLERVR